MSAPGGEVKSQNMSCGHAALTKVKSIKPPSQQMKLTHFFASAESFTIQGFENVQVIREYKYRRRHQ